MHILFAFAKNKILIYVFISSANKCLSFSSKYQKTHKMIWIANWQRSFAHDWVGKIFAVGVLEHRLDNRFSLATSRAFERLSNALERNEWLPKCDADIVWWKPQRKSPVHSIGEHIRSIPALARNAPSTNCTRRLHIWRTMFVCTLHSRHQF